MASVEASITPAATTARMTSQRRTLPPTTRSYPATAIPSASGGSAHAHQVIAQGRDGSGPEPGDDERDGPDAGGGTCRWRHGPRVLGARIGREDAHAGAVERPCCRARVVPEGVYRWLNGRVQVAP